jgi:hypothetical protein
MLKGMKFFGEKICIEGCVNVGLLSATTTPSPGKVNPLPALAIPFQLSVVVRTVRANPNMGASSRLALIVISRTLGIDAEFLSGLRVSGESQ